MADKSLGFVCFHPRIEAKIRDKAIELYFVPGASERLSQVFCQRLITLGACFTFLKPDMQTQALVFHFPRQHY